MKLTNTLTGSKTDFEPVRPPQVGVYLCGPTVYDVPHMGHARSEIVYDVLRRTLTRRGYEVFFVRNITDVDDKIIKLANERDIHPARVAEQYTRAYDEAMSFLNVVPPDIAPRAGAHIPEMIEMIETLIDKGLAYEGENNVFFAVEKFEDYGKLARRPVDDMSNEARIDSAPGKHNDIDFSLWKKAKLNEPSWNSPWGRGRPGWHIECSAMVAKYFELPIDIHAGGSDLTFPHHENELAQSQGASGNQFARWWLHHGMVQLKGEKMSKSLKNYVFVTDVLADYSPDVVRLFVLGAHYRSQVSFSTIALDQAKAVWDRFMNFLRSGPAGELDESLLAEFESALDDDLNTPAALAALHALVSDGRPEARAALAAGLDRLGCRSDPAQTDLAPLVELLVEQREKARAAKDFATSDAIRDRLASAGIVLEDTTDGARWRHE